MPSKHQWKFVFSVVDSIGLDIENDLKTMKVLKEEYYQDLLISSGYFSDPRFTWVGMTIRYGLINDRCTEFQGISKKYECIDLAKQLDVRVLSTADEYDVDMLMDFFKIASLDSLIEAGIKYNLNPSAIETLKNERAKLGQIPDWEYEMDEHPEILLEKYRESIGRPVGNNQSFGIGTCSHVDTGESYIFDESITFQYFRVRNDYIMPLLNRVNYFKGKKFSFIFLLIHLYNSNDRKTYISGNSARYRDVNLARDLDVRLLILDMRNNFNLLYDFVKITALDALIDAGIKYKVNKEAIEILKEERTKLGHIPDWDSDMEEYPEILLKKYLESVPK